MAASKPFAQKTETEKRIVMKPVSFVIYFLFLSFTSLLLGFLARN